MYNDEIGKYFRRGVDAELDDATGKWETKQLIVTIIHKRGPSAPMIAE
jgi:hypothetical protein